VARQGDALCQYGNTHRAKISRARSFSPPRRVMEPHVRMVTGKAGGRKALALGVCCQIVLCAALEPPRLSHSTRRRLWEKFL